MNAEPYRLGEIANKLGKSSDWLREHRAKLQADFKMPAPLPVPGHPRWDRARIDAWLAGWQQPVPANDAAPLDMTDWRTRLRSHYRRAAGD